MFAVHQFPKSTYTLNEFGNALIGAGSWWMWNPHCGTNGERGEGVWECGIGDVVVDRILGLY